MTQDKIGRWELMMGVEEDAEEVMHASSKQISEANGRSWVG